MKIDQITPSLFKGYDEGVEIVIKSATSAKPNPNGGLAIPYTIYHVYDDEGIYIGQAKDLKGDMERVMRDYRTKLKS